jgi:hypothetical protein
MHLPLIAALAALVITGPAAPASPSDLLDSVRAYQEAANRHDWSAVRPLMAENAVIELGGDLAIVGRDNARALHEWERAMETRITYSACAASGQAVTCEASEENDFLRVAGLGPITYRASTIVFENGRVVRMKATLSEESARVVSEYMQPFLAWASESAPNAVHAFLADDGTFRFGFDSAMTFKRLVRAYAASRTGASRAL